MEHMYFFRADGNATTGAGHLMRCATIATALAGRLGGKDGIRFVCADDQSASLAAQQGFQAVVLGSDYRDMCGELPLWQGLFRNGTEGNVILVDSYFITDQYLMELGKKNCIGVMDDYGSHAYPVDFVINYNAPASQMQYEDLYRGRDIRLVIGSRYIPVREQFLHTDYQVRERVHNVLITTGGGDLDNIAGQIWKLLYNEQMEFHVVVGQFGTHIQKMQDLAARHGNLHIHYNVRDMAGLMKECDIAITAGGSTVYELSAMGVPFICFSYAENQEILTRYIRDSGIAGEAGAWHRDPVGTGQNLKQLFDRLADSRSLRVAFWEKERDMIDGQGAARLAEILSRL